TAQKTLAELKETLLNLQTGLEHLGRNISDKLKPLGYVLDPVDPQSTIHDLKSNIQTWQDQVRKKAEIEKQIADIDSRIKRLDAVMETQRTALTQKQEHLEQLNKEYAAGLDERKKHYGDKHPDHEEDCLNKAIADAETNEKKARILNSELQQKLTTAKAHIESLKKRIEQRQSDLKKADLEFWAALESAGFADETQFLGARLTNEQREALFFRAKKLDTALTDLAARQKDRETQLAAKMAINLTDRSLEELETQFNGCEASLKELRDTMAGLRHRLSENRAARERIKEKQAAITAQKKECSRFEKLHGLIGSADGKKYRNFAQGLTFELMVAHANGQLEKMTDRYLLIRDDEQPLELNVVDNYQAGEIRSTRNLSGGESFIVSLTLALGLSKMASRKVRVDSLFLDEGFGTLDEETLETALETLSGLQQDGKLIGIISHVSALKERIRTRINIIPVSGGRSLLSGPGCRKVDQSF
ncbi:MAG: chromosome segregation protein SMC, partial [Proteobacteria bacterium]|nr:chromosome segregation protein SMC [Pseudomonadota bacterium]